MASFLTSATQSGFDAQTYVSQVSQSRNQNREGFYRKDYHGGSVKPNQAYTSSYDVVGISTKQIPEMRQAIRNYVDNVNQYLSGVQSELDPTIALKGTGMEAAVTDYIASVVKYCQGICSNLLAFSDKLAKVEEAWRSSDANMSNTINGATTGVNSAGQFYQEQF